MKHLYLLLFSIFTLPLISLTADGQESEKISKARFEMINIPSTLKKPKDRAEYLVNHYWDNFNFNNEALIDQPMITEQAMVNYLDLKSHVQKDVMRTSIKNLMIKAESNRDMFRHISDLLEKYLYDPESPLEDEELFITALEYITKAPSIDDIDKIRPTHLLELLQKNRIGYKASNFTYTIANGNKGELNSISSNYLLLFFNDPDCHQCEEAKREINKSYIINKLIKKGSLIILSIYPGEDIDSWKNHSTAMPQNWINSYDAGCRIKNEEIYDLKSSPTLYLLSKDKTVLLKNCTLNKIEQYLIDNEI